MAIPTWPLSLPQTPMRDGFSETYPNNQLRSQFDAGVAKIRRKGSTPPRTITVGYYLTPAQRDTLTTFVMTTLQDGVLRFTFKHPVSKLNVEVRLLAEGDGIVTFTPVSWDLWQVSLKLEILP